MLRIVEVIIKVISEVAPRVEQIGRHDAALAKQLRDALNSVALNVAEGSGQRGARQNSHYAIALGAARESLVALRAAEAWAYVGPLPEPTVRAFDPIIGTLVRLAHR